MPKYRLQPTGEFDKKVKKLLKFDSSISEKLKITLKRLSTDPFYPGLKTHKAEIRNYGYAYSSRVTGDIRIAWIFADANTIIVLLTIGGHGGGGVYN